MFLGFPGSCMRPVHYQRRGGKKSLERLLPVSLGSIPILLAQPGDIVPVRARWRRFMADATLDRVVEIPQFREENRHAPSIEEGMVMAPDELELVFAGSDQKNSHRRHFRKIETPLPISVKKIIETLTQLGRSAPVKADTVQLRLAVDNL